MDFEKIMPLIIGDFEKEGIQYALIGGFAMGAIGLLKEINHRDHRYEVIEKISLCSPQPKFTMVILITH